MKNLSDSQKLGILIGLFVAMFAGALMLSPLPVDPNYHNFADQRSCLGIPNFADVASNLPFGVLGVMGLVLVFGRRGREAFEFRYHAWPYLVFFGGVTLVMLGSSYYHWAPSNGPLYWDRAPIAIAFMGLFAAFLADRTDQRIGVFWLLPLLLFLATAAMLWDLSQFGIGGDLRFYALVQIYPIIALPLLCWFYPGGRYTSTPHMYAMLAWYAVAKILEIADRPIFEMLAGTVSGHTLKHLSAAMAVFMVLSMLRRMDSR
ncbi:MAG TPA: alkaline phytoceramidase [Rhodospirillaceae bacterium]|nr:alkaline phytoceramidase [Rhodospirillaceae bacterium]HAA93698.1 alkaline phytoceramidase [Rhodospirillaceae bacterium]HAT35356.1 alkaline phytoceramidase [Rhodospirillaceae bacterium]|tara:strand:+ start:530 stop:1309 length:780 start_codon:yes stop_codon:yes gene_type:complete